MASESPSTIANYALNIKTQGLDKNFYKTYLENIDKVTKEDVIRVANKYFLIDKGQVIVTGKGSELIDKLEKVSFNGNIVPISYYDKYGNNIKKPVFKKEISEGISVKSIFDNYTVLDLVKNLNIPIKKVAIELNQQIIDKKKISKINLKKNDKIEIVHFIGGG